MKKVSVIVPVYNVRLYLKKCVDSIVAQTYDNIEIILVDDGSNDGSCELCNAIANDSDKIKVIHKSNGGLSSARNAGIENATGDYICFIDSDDIISPIYVEHLTDILEKNNCDIAVGKYVQFSNIQPVFDLSNSFNTKVLSGIQSIDMLFGVDYVNSTITCNKLFNIKLFEKLRFIDGKINEDEDIMYQLFYASNSVVFSDKIIYGYYKRQDSITKKQFSYKNFDFLEISVKRYEFFRDIGEERYYHLFLKNYCWALLDFSKKTKEILNDKKTSKKLVREFKQKSRILLKSQHISPVKKVALMLIRIFPTLYFTLCKCIN